MPDTHHIDATAPELRALFVRLGEALYGAHWQQPMAAALGLTSARRVRYWASGDKIPAGIWRDLRALAVTRQSELAELISRFAEAKIDELP